MTQSKWTALILAGLLGSIITLALIEFVNQRRVDSSLEDAAQNLSMAFSKRINDLSASYKRGNSTNHLRSTLSTLRLVNRTSVRALLPEIDKLEDAIARDGLAPYVSVAMEIAHRFGRNQSTILQEHYSRLAKAALNGIVEGQSAKAGFVVLIKEKRKRSYRQYDENTGRAVARLVFSEFGRAQFQRGQWPSDVLRTAAMLAECEKGGSGQAVRSAAANRDCLRFAGLVADELKESGQANLITDLLADFGRGTSVKRFACFEGEQVGNELIERVEAFAACVAGLEGNPIEWRLDGSTISSSTVESEEPPELEGYTYRDSGPPVEYVGIDGIMGTQVTHEYENSTGGKATFSRYRYENLVNGEIESGTHLKTDDGKGNTHEEHRNSQGELTWSFTEYSNGNTEDFQKTDKGSVKVSTNNETGVTKVEFTDKEGNRSEANVDADGNCTGAACDADIGSSASTPVDESGWAPACAKAPTDPRFPDNGLTTDPLGPYIYPSPDSSDANPLMTCLIQSVASSHTDLQCPPSVAFCFEPPPAGSCTCGGGRVDVSLPTESAACNRIECAEGSHCDAATGVCTSSGNNGDFGVFSPGVNPLPPPE